MCGLHYVVGNGTLVEFWNDIWLGHTPLRVAYSSIFDKVKSKNCKIKECWGERGWRWRKILAGFTPRESGDGGRTALLREELCNTLLQEWPDEVRWQWDTNGKFSVKSLYNFLEDGGVPERRFVKLWKIKVPLKVRIFGWLLLRNRTLTAEVLLKRGWTGDGRCRYCLEEIESGDHLFARCRFSLDILAGVLTNKTLVYARLTPAELWEALASNWGVFGRKELTLLLISWWVLWLERNQRIFEDKKQSPRQLVAEIRALGSFWESCCSL